MWTEIAVAIVVLSAVLGVVSRVVSTRRGTDGRSVEGPGEQRGGAWSAERPIEAAFPVERTPRERDIGDAAFVDGLVIGHYLAPFRPAEERDAVQPEPADLVLDGDDGTATTAWGSFDAAPSDEPADQTADDFGLDLDADADTSEDGFDDGYDLEDDLDDDW